MPKQKTTTDEYFPARFIPWLEGAGFERCIDKSLFRLNMGPFWLFVQWHDGSGKISAELYHRETRTWLGATTCMGTPKAFKAVSTHIAGLIQTVEYMEVSK